MMTLAVLGWQLTIVLTLGLARLFGDIFNKPSSIYWVSGAWIVFTLVSLFYFASYCSAACRNFPDYKNTCSKRESKQT